jgi:hypothetical protein
MTDISQQADRSIGRLADKGIEVIMMANFEALGGGRRYSIAFQDTFVG